MKVDDDEVLIDCERKLDRNCGTKLGRNRLMYKANPAMIRGLTRPIENCTNSASFAMSIPQNRNPKNGTFPAVYTGVWDLADAVLPEAELSNGQFFVVTNYIVTPNQTRGKTEL